LVCYWAVLRALCWAGPWAVLRVDPSAWSLAGLMAGSRVVEWVACWAFPWVVLSADCWAVMRALCWAAWWVGVRADPLVCSRVGARAG